MKGKTVLTKLIITFRSFAKVPKYQRRRINNKLLKKLWQTIIIIITKIISIIWRAFFDKNRKHDLSRLNVLIICEGPRMQRYEGASGLRFGYIFCYSVVWCMCTTYYIVLFIFAFQRLWRSKYKDKVNTSIKRARIRYCPWNSRRMDSLTMYFAVGFSWLFVPVLCNLQYLVTVCWGQTDILG